MMERDEGTKQKNWSPLGQIFIGLGIIVAAVLFISSPAFYRFFPDTKPATCEQAAARYASLRDRARDAWRKLSPVSTHGEQEDHQKLAAHRILAQQDCIRLCTAAGATTSTRHSESCILAWERSSESGEACEVQLLADPQKIPRPLDACYASGDEP